jgi:hypothetical protein
LEARSVAIVRNTAKAVTCRARREPTEAKTVRQIFEWFVGGVSLRAIAHRLNAEQVPFPADSIRRGGKRKG